MTVVPGEGGTRVTVRTVTAASGGGSEVDWVQVDVQPADQAGHGRCAVVERGALVRALLPDDVRGYLLDLIDTMDDGQEREMGYAADVRERAADLIALR